MFGTTAETETAPPMAEPLPLRRAALALLLVGLRISPGGAGTNSKGDWSFTDDAEEDCADYNNRW